MRYSVHHYHAFFPCFVLSFPQLNYPLSAIYHLHRVMAQLWSVLAKVRQYPSEVVQLLSQSDALEKVILQSLLEDFVRAKVFILLGSQIIVNAFKHIFADLILQIDVGELFLMLRLNAPKMVEFVFNLHFELINFVADKGLEVTKAQFVDVLELFALVGLVVVDIIGENRLLAIDTVFEMVFDFTFALAGTDLLGSGCWQGCMGGVIGTQGMMGRLYLLLRGRLLSLLFLTAHCQVYEGSFRMPSRPLY